MENINLNKRVYNKDQYEKVIDTSFTQLNVPEPQEEQPLRTNEEIEGLINEVEILRNQLSSSLNPETLP
jgi:hypothetical protein